MPLVSLDAVTIAFGHLPVLDSIALRVEPRERIAVIGRNGTGKSTLLKIISPISTKSTSNPRTVDGGSGPRSSERPANGRRPQASRC